MRVRVYDGRKVVQDETLVLEKPTLKTVQHTIQVGAKQKVKVRFDFDPALTFPEAPE